jgi:hypothetical protein
MRNIEELKRKLKSTLTLVSFSFHFWVVIKENLGNMVKAHFRVIRLNSNWNPFYWLESSTFEAIDFTLGPKNLRELLT